MASNGDKWSSVKKWLFPAIAAALALGAFSRKWLADEQWRGSIVTALWAPSGLLILAVIALLFHGFVVNNLGSGTIWPWVRERGGRLLVVIIVVAALVSSFLSALEGLANEQWRGSIVTALKVWLPSSLLALAILAGIAWFARWFLKNMPDGDQDAKPMTSRARMFVVVFLLVLAVTIVLSILRLFTLNIPDPQPGTFPDLAQPTSLPEGTPQIQQVVLVAVDATGVETINVYGYHFKQESQLHVDETTLGPKNAVYLGEHLIAAKLDSNEASKDSTILFVQNGDTKSNSVLLATITGTGARTALTFGPWRWFINRETQLLLLVILAGALGSYLHAMQSFANYLGNRSLKASWFLFYVTRPFVGMGLALIFYALIRGGFLAGSPADAKAVNPFGVVAIAGLVGMFADKATQKLSEVFETLFKTDKSDERTDKLTKPSITALDPETVLTGKLPPPAVVIRGSNLSKVTTIFVGTEKRDATSPASDSVTLQLKETDVKENGGLSIAVAESDGAKYGDLTLHISDLKITTESLNVKDNKVDEVLAAEGGEKPHTWRVPDLPKGLNFDKEHNRITGTLEDPKFTGTVKISVTDKQGATTGADIPLKRPEAANQQG